jgi:regulatory protein
MPSDEDLKQARALAYRYLSHRDRSARETVDHLKKKGFEEAVVQETLRYLKEAKYLDDRRFAEHWARTRAENRQYGKYRLRQELIGKGLSKELIDETLDTLFESVKEIDLARAVVEKKLPSMQDLPADKKKNRLIGLLQRKGFSLDIVYKVLD